LLRTAESIRVHFAVRSSIDGILSESQELAEVPVLPAGEYKEVGVVSVRKSLSKYVAAAK